MKSASSIKIGLALGSGGAKGWAHIGVIKGLIKLGVNPSQIAGSSIGALVGAAYANDRLDELETWVSDFSSWDVLGLLDLNLKKGGLMGGDKVFDFVQSYIGELKIENLNRAFTAVATDLYTGQEVWFSKGDLRHAVRASCSMPGILSPVKHSRRWLVDGAVVNPVPVSVSRAMGADIVIAVDVNGWQRSRINNFPKDLSQHDPVTVTTKKNYQTVDNLDGGFIDLLARGKDYIAHLSTKFSLGSKQMPGMLAVMSQSMDILEQRHKSARLLGDPPNICITPKLDHIGTMEFHRAKEAIIAGEEAVLLHTQLIEEVITQS